MSPTVYESCGIYFVIPTGDHGFPHIHVCYPSPKNYEAFAKIRLDNFDVLEAFGFKKKALKEIVAHIEKNQQRYLELWIELGGQVNE